MQYFGRGVQGDGDLGGDFIMGGASASPLPAVAVAPGAAAMGDAMLMDLRARELDQMGAMGDALAMGLSTREPSTWPSTQGYYLSSDAESVAGLDGLPLHANLPAIPDMALTPDSGTPRKPRKRYADVEEGEESIRRLVSDYNQLLHDRGLPISKKIRRDASVRQARI